MSANDDLLSTSTLARFGDPLILDSDMGEDLQGADLEFFTSAISHEDPLADSGVLGEDPFAASATRDASAGGLLPTHQNPTDYPEKAGALGANKASRPGGAFRAISDLSSTSPEASTQDSLSDSSRRHKRKSSSNSSLSLLPGVDTMMTDEADMRDIKPDDLMLGVDGTGLVLTNDYASFVDSGMDHDFEVSNKAMEHHFDFESAGSSPSALDMHIQSGRNLKTKAPRFNMAYHTHAAPSPDQKRSSQQANFMTGNSKLGNLGQTSREPSPMSGMSTSQGLSPATYFNAPSPSSLNGDFNGQTMVGGPSFNTFWSPGYAFDGSESSVSKSKSRVGVSPLANGLASPLSVTQSIPDESAGPSLIIHPTPLKSRVETQIPIKLSLYPMPPGVSKLHLPKHTISKPKLLAKPPAEKSPDTLELSTMLVCTSAMNTPENLRKALERAAENDSDRKSSESERPSSEDSQEENEEDKPLNGGEVKICAGCITRERKRAARKKIKKVEEEESWHQDEHKRVIVFNTQEVKDWQKPSKENILDDDGQPQPVLPEGAMQVDAPMRIACYCRHQNEKLGFQVIFTIKDHEDRVISQAISQSIMITDDHKTHAPPPAVPGQVSGAYTDDSQIPPSGLYPMMNGYEHIPVNGMSPFRMSHSTNDLQALQQNFNPQFIPQSTPIPSQEIPPAVAGTLTPRTLSRQASITGNPGQPAKKRKSSGSPKVPSGLAMTRLETSPNPTGNTTSAGPSSAGATITSPYAPSHHFIPENFNMPPAYMGPGFPAGPTTPGGTEQPFINGVQRSHSMENLPLMQMFSAPTSRHASRAPSPTSAHMGNTAVYQQNPAQMAQAVANSMYGIPTALNPHRPPTIHKLIPNEGPKAGGIEVTCLGSGFCQGLEVCFGDTMATTTTYWGDTSLVCLLPPAVHAGTVPVTFKHERQHQMRMQFPSIPMAKPQVVFKYVDDDEQQLLRMALSVLGHKMTGRMEDVRDIARRIVGGGSAAWPPQGATSPPSGGQHRQASSFGEQMLEVLDQETTLLKCLDFIDLDDSPNQPRLNLRRSNGQTMLHLAASLGFHRFVAALFARGANPEPRDKNGFTPAHFAAMHGHVQIVRRLILNGADPGMRSLNGFTPADLASSEEVLQATRKISAESRRRSVGSVRSRSRASSVASVSSLWGDVSPSPAAARPAPLADSDLEDGISSEACSDDADIAEQECFQTVSRTNSGLVEGPNVPATAVPAASGIMSPAAAMAAWRGQLAAQLHSLQQQVHLNLPNLQMPTLPPMPALPDYQAYLPNPMVRRISSLRGPQRPGSSRSEIDSGKEGDYRWWELFSGPSPSPPPAYDEIYPKGAQEKTDLKKSSAAVAAADAVVDQYYSQPDDASQSSTSSGSTPIETTDVRLGSNPLTEQQQKQLRIAHAKKMKRIRYDRRLFFVWIPLLIFVLALMVKAPVAQVWDVSIQIAVQVRETAERRFLEVA